MQKYFNIFFDLLLIFLSYFIPKKNNSILLGAGDGTGFKGNPKYVYLYLLNNPGLLQPCWITGNKTLLLDLKRRNLPGVYKYSIAGFLAILRSRFLFIEIMPKDIIYAGFFSIGRFNYIQTFHGMPLKKIGHDANHDYKGMARVNLMHIDIIDKFASMIKSKLKLSLLYKGYKLITASSDECRDIYIHAFRNNKVMALGFARNDIFFDSSLMLNNFIEILGLRGYKKIYSFIPTFRDVKTSINPFPEELLKKINAYMVKTDSIFLIKKHPYDRTLIVDSGYSHIRDVSLSVEDVMELLAITDVLITDYSSVFFDFALTGKPIIYYSYDLEDYLSICRGMYYDYFNDLPGPFASNHNELFKLITEIEKWFTRKDYREKYNAFTVRFNKYRDGNSSMRLINFITGSFI